MFSDKLSLQAGKWSYRGVNFTRLLKPESWICWEKIHKSSSPIWSKKKKEKKIELIIVLILELAKSFFFKW